MFNPACTFVSYDDLATAIRRNLSRLPQDLDLIVGIPRSGMIPAYMIGLYQNLQISNIETFIANRTIEHGQTRKLKREHSKPLNAQHILLVDDSFYGGASLQAAYDRIIAAGYQGRITTCAAIITPLLSSKVDLSFIEAPLPRVFEWNVFHHDMLSNACMDFDGVLCVDPTDEENDDGKKYEAFLEKAKPLYLPSLEIGHIVSARLEKYRKETEAWLQTHGVKYKHLHLLNVATKAERQRTQAHHKHKIDVYNETQATLFIESSYEQALLIAKATGKPVLCTDQMQMIQGGGVHFKTMPLRAKQMKQNIAYYAYRFLIARIPPNLRKTIKRGLGRG